MLQLPNIKKQPARNSVSKRQVQTVLHTDSSSQSKPQHVESEKRLLSPSLAQPRVLSKKGMQQLQQVGGAIQPRQGSKKVAHRRAISSMDPSQINFVDQRAKACGSPSPLKGSQSPLQKARQLKKISEVDVSPSGKLQQSEMSNFKIGLSSCNSRLDCVSPKQSIPRKLVKFSSHKLEQSQQVSKNALCPLSPQSKKAKSELRVDRDVLIKTPEEVLRRKELMRRLALKQSSEQQFEEKIPEIDVEDLFAQLSGKANVKRQFDPVYAQSAYMAAMDRELAIGDYTEYGAVSAPKRHDLIKLIDDIHICKGYREETFYLAVSIADKFLVFQTIRKRPIPCLVNLSLICCLMAAKLEQPISPSFNRMIKLAKSEWNCTVFLQDLIDLEEQIVRTLDFDVQNTSPLPFLDRYLRIFNLDQNENCHASAQVSSLARLVMRDFTFESKSLNFKPS